MIVSIENSSFQNSDGKKKGENKKSNVKKSKNILKIRPGFV
jgi:hypothetical protein